MAGFKLELWSQIHRQIAMELPNRSGDGVGPEVKLVAVLDVAWPNLTEIQDAGPMVR